MNGSLKIGAVSGLIAGFVLVIVSEISLNTRLSLGLAEPFTLQLLQNNTLVNIPLFIFWGIVLGIVYSKIHSLIPGKGVWKGLIYGALLFVIVTFRFETFMIPYGALLNAVGHLFWGIFVWVAYGLSLGFFYKLLLDKYYLTIEEPKIVTYDVKSGLLPGAVAGLMEGITAGCVSVIGHLTGLWGVVTGGVIVNTIGFWISQFATHILLNMIWATVFGAFFALVYHLVPGKKVIKGLIYGLIMFCITSFQLFTWIIVWYANHNLWQLVYPMILNILVYGFDFVVFGIVLGALYRKPSD